MFNFTVFIIKEISASSLRGALATKQSIFNTFTINILRWIATSGVALLAMTAITAYLNTLQNNLLIHYAHVLRDSRPVTGARTPSANVMD